jgi:hypothetical protein
VVLKLWPPAVAFGIGPLQVPEPGTPTPAESPQGQSFNGGSKRRRLWNEYQSLQALDETDPALGALGHAVMAWAETVPDMTWRKAERVPELKPAITVQGEPLTLFTLSREGRVYLAVDTWKRLPEMSDVDSRRQYLQRINQAVGSSMRLLAGWPHFPATVLYDVERRLAFLALMEDLANQLRTAPALRDPSADTGDDVPARATGELAIRYQHFLTEILDRFMALDTSLAKSPSVGPRNWLPFNAGRPGFSFVWSISEGKRFRVELYIDVGDRNINKEFFDRLRSEADEIDRQVGSPVEWERLDEKKACRLAIYRETETERFDSDRELVDWAANTMIRFSRVMRPLIAAL